MGSNEVRYRVKGPEAMTADHLDELDAVIDFMRKRVDAEIRAQGYGMGGTDFHFIPAALSLAKAVAATHRKTFEPMHDGAYAEVFRNELEALWRLVMAGQCVLADAEAEMEEADDAD